MNINGVRVDECNLVTMLPLTKIAMTNMVTEAGAFFWTKCIRFCRYNLDRQYKQVQSIIL